MNEKLLQILFVTLYKYIALKEDDLFLLAGDGGPPWSSDSVLDHKSLPPVFESRRGQI